MTKSLKRTLYISLATLMVASAGTANASAIAVNAKRRPHISRRAHYTKHYIHRSYKHSRHAYHKAHRVHRRAHHLVLRSGAFSGMRAPWKRAWNKYYKGSSLRITYGSARRNGVLSTAKYLDRVHYNHSLSNSSNKNAWNKYFVNHTRKGAFIKHLVSYPEFDQLQMANNNVNSERNRNYYLIEFPYNYSHRTDGRANAELFGDQVLHGYTYNMRHSLRNVAVPATNGQRISRSFSHMMSENRHHPKIQIGSLSYVLDNNGHFKPNAGTNGFGLTYKFNPKANHYERVSTDQISQKILQAQKNTDDLLQQQHNADVQQIINNPALTKSTKQLCLRLIQLPKVQGPIQVYKAASKSKKVTSPQRTRLAYMEHSIIQHYEKVHEADVKAHTLALKKNFLYLQIHGAFNHMSHKQANRLANKLAINPSILKYYMKEYGANTAAKYTKHPVISKVRANHFAKKHNMTDHNGLITNNKQLAREIAMLQYDIEALAKADGYTLPSNMNQAQQF